MLAAAADGGITQTLVTASATVLVAALGLIGVVVGTRAKRNSPAATDNTEGLIVNLAQTLSEERDGRLVAERERDLLRAQLDACIARETKLKRRPR